MTTNDKDIEINAVLIGELFGVPPAEVLALLKAHVITSICERGIGEHQGEMRLTFFYGNRRARVSIDENGKILRSMIDFGDRPIPHRAC